MECWNWGGAGALASLIFLAGPADAQVLIHQVQGGGSAGRGAGQALGSAGDVDRDGQADLLIGYRYGSTAAGPDCGTVQVVSGRTGALLWEHHGESALDRLGRAVAGVGDVDGDGHSDYAAGADGDDDGGSSSGSVRVWSGADGSLLWRRDGEAANDHLGISLAGGGDFDGDGWPDLVVGASTAQGADYLLVLSGTDGSLLQRITGNGLGSRLGGSLAVVGDIDGDGRPEVLAGDARAHGAANFVGSVTLFSGADGSVLRTFLGDLANDQLGQRVAAVGDVDGDGTPDLGAGTPWADGAVSDNGLVRIWSGATGAVLHEWRGDSSFEQFGSALAGTGDLDGDGHGDLVVGAFAERDGGSLAGRATVYSGDTGAVLYVFDGGPGDELGFDVFGGVDFDGDGRPDFALGAPGDNAGAGPLSGTVSVWTSEAPPTLVLHYCRSSPNSVGPGALIDARGSTSIAADDLVLTVSGAPSSTLGLFLFSPRTMERPFRGGYLCVGWPRFRMRGFVATGPDGSAEKALGLTGARGRLRCLSAGETWNFQFIYLDPGARWRRKINLSDAIAVPFMP